MNKFLNPINYLVKILNLKDKIFYHSGYDIEKIREVEAQKFLDYGFDYSKALAKMNNILKELGEDDFHSSVQKGMASVHWLLFCGISEKHTINNILEIGTFDGETTLILSKIFPNSSISTVDLPDDDPILTSTYQRDNQVYLNEFLEKQRKNTSGDNIKLIRKNSFFLPASVNEKFDLIWVDGGHLYPEISWDICNAYHLCKDNGWIMYDDVIPDKGPSYAAGVNSDSHDILQYLQQRIKQKIIYFLKRDNIYFSANPRKRKFVALMRK